MDSSSSSAVPDADKVDKLKDKCTQIRQANQVLKKGLLEKQEECARVEKELKEKDAAVKQQLQEISDLQALNGRYTKQSSSLTVQLEELQKQKQQTSWTMPGFKSAKQQQEMLQKVEEELQVLQQELVMKIQETEDLHIQMHDAQMQHEEHIQQLEDMNATVEQELQLRVVDVDSEKERKNRLASENEELERRIRAAEDQLQKLHQSAESLQTALEENRSGACRLWGQLHSQLSREAPFQEMQQTLWKSSTGKQTSGPEDASRNLQASVKEVSLRSSAVLRRYVRADATAGDLPDSELVRKASDGSSLSEALRAQAEALKLAAARSRLKAQVQHQVRRLREVGSAKSALSQQLLTLQDEHSSLKSSLEALQYEMSNSVAQNTAVGGSLTDGIVQASRRRLSLPLEASAASTRQQSVFTDFAPLSSAEVQMAGSQPAMEAPHTWEFAVRRSYEQHIHNLEAQAAAADAKADSLRRKVNTSSAILTEQEEAKQRLCDEVGVKHAELDGVLEDLATTRKNYDAQLAMLSDHVRNLSSQLSDKDATLASLQTRRVLCGNCGVWNTMANLLHSREARGGCSSCKEKLLTEG